MIHFLEKNGPFSADEFLHFRGIFNRFCCFRGLEDSAYDMSKFEDAQRRAMAASMEPVSTFSPMQVRRETQCHDRFHRSYFGKGPD